MKKFYFLATALVALASCTSDSYIGEGAEPDANAGNEISFSSNLKATTRADIYGNAAATLLGNNFYVTGTKGTEGTANPTTTLVFDNYLVHYTANTADLTQSNTANWEYVGVTPGTSPYGSYVKLATTAQSQTIKYWDYNTTQYDFLAFSTGTYAAVSGSSTASTNIGVTAMKYGANLASNKVAYTFDIPSVDALTNTYISDITEVMQANYGKEVQLKFKNLGSKVRVALYETVPGYSVQGVKFYTVDGTTTFTDANKSTTATLISASTLPTSGKIAVYFPHVGTDNTSAQDYNKAAATVTAGSSTVTYQQYGTLYNFATKESYEAAGSYLGRSLTAATFAGSSDASYYTTVFPVSSSNPLTLRVDYTLVSTDGSGETINVYGAKAVVPATYTKWLPNYAYTYIFKISDNTNGWTSSTAAGQAGLYPITFDAVVTEATDATAEQTTITTVAAPTITTYQQNHDNSTNEYSKATGKDIYVQVMDNSTATASLVTTLAAANSLLYAVNDADATEAEVMSALEMRTTAVSANDVVGRNGITLTNNSNISNTVTSIVNGVDNNPITVASGSAAMLDISELAAGTYAYVYIPTASTKEVNQFEPVTVTTGSAISGSSSDTFYTLTTTQIAAGTALTAAETADADYIYFSVTENGTGSTTYSYISSIGKTTIPAGCIKIAKSSLTTTVTGDTNAAADTFYFDKYITNNGSYAVKVIKVVA